MSPLAIVTGGSAGIGAATVRQLSAAGWTVATGARRLERLHEEIAGTGAHAFPLDVTSHESIAAFVDSVHTRCDGPVRLLVNNAGGALGVDSVAEADESLWQRMYQTNVLGVLRLTQAFLPALRASGDGHVINVGSIAAFETYAGGAGYTASKHALRAMTRTLRLELLGEPIRVTEVDPGLVDTEFSTVRFDGDRERADAVYQGLEPLQADDIAECIVWAASRPSHVNIDEILVRPRDQATATAVHRRQQKASD